MEDFTPQYQYIPSKEKVISNDPEIGLGQTIGGMQVDAQQLSQGKVTIQGVAQRILIGDATAPLTGIGIFMGSDQASTVGYDFRVGNPSGQYIHWDASAGTFIISGTIVIGGQYRTVAPGDDIQTAIDAVNAAGGGTVVLQNGTHTPASDLTLYSKITLEGQNGDSAIIDFGTTGHQLRGIGTGVYTTGTVSVSNNGTTVTGSGTTWTGNVTAGQYIMLAGVWYPITNVGGNTTLTIGIPFADVALSGATYTAATILSNVHVKSLTVKNSTTSSIKFQYVNNLFLYDVATQASLAGTEIDTCSQISFLECDAIANYTNYIFTNAHFMIHNGSSSIDALSGHGYQIDKMTNSSISSSFILNSSSDGMNISNSSNCRIDVVTAENAGSGVEFVSGNDNIIFGPARVESNGADGIKLTASSDNIFITNAFIKNNTGYGVNNVSSTNDNLVITGNNFTGNSTSACNDSGTGTVIRGNVGLVDNSTSGLGQVVKSFTAGESISMNDAIYIKLDTGSGAYDNAYNAINQSGNFSQSYTTTTESNRIMIISVAPQTSGSFSSPAVTYNGVSATLLTTNTYNTNYKQYIFMLLAPDTGSNTLAFTGHNGLTYGISVWTGYGFTQSYTPDATQHTTGSASTFSGNVTTVSSGDWIVSCHNAATGGTIVAGTNFSLRAGTDGRSAIGDSNTGIVPAGSTTTSGSSNTSQPYSWYQIALSPITAPAPKAYKASASATGTSNGFIGFASAAASAQSTVNCIIAGVVSNFSNIGLSSQYYLANTAGTISTSAGSVTRKVGIGVSTTDILITNIW